MSWFSKLADNPLRSWQHFKVAVSLFVLAVILIFSGYAYLAILQIPGLLVLLIALVFAVRGYVGILSYRLTQFKVQTSSRKHTQFDK